MSIPDRANCMSGLNVT